MRDKKNKGQALVEFAIVIPLLMIFVMAIIEFGFMFNAYITISNASREAARLGAVGGNNAAIETRVDDVAQDLNLAEITVNITPTTRSRGDMLSVTVTYDYQLITPVISNLLSPFVNLESETVMRVE
jgi:Flp pilus assembly protein TadG